MSFSNTTIQGAGFGLRRPHLGSLSDHPDTPDTIADFLEVAPENWMALGGKLRREFRAQTERYPFVCHGLSLNLGGMMPLDETFLLQLKQFMHEHRIRLYSEHLSYCADQGHLYDLMPLPFTEEAVHHVAGRIRQVQDILEQRLAVENVSFYAMMPSEMSEQAFIQAVLQEADCDLLLDVNNVYVNSINHHYDAVEFIDAMPSDRIAYIHMAGHYVESDDLIIDTHGADIDDPVWTLLQHTYQRHGVLPTLLERDFNLPSLDTLLEEVRQIRRYQQEASNHDHIRYA